jgi:outer membrane protein assembly factor BamD (BamD/ComL family)
MKKIFALTLLLTVVFACQSGKKEEEKTNENPMPVKTAEELDKGAERLDLLLKENMPNIDQQQYITAINTHYQFSQNYPNHEKAAYHLDKAQGYCVQIKDYARSEKMLAQLFRDYPEYVKANNGEMYYLRASNLDFILGEDPKTGPTYKREAKRLYQEFIELFPTHPLVEDAKYRLETMDLTAEDIIKNAKK